ncbi:DUF317 domain-containing protein [Kitasatospora aureofaciens]|uniref:DUF317 domain-containing protein n=1 Tax=Kitasatospora aureofaciens TaxID=1894 RepID=UPI001C479539|nr:DUF317 domain-containing protein [Kitasatospora aureofaciens]MBV6695573.1 DUF317 domain-containing protein [Kitasatospora aureofaciens]
MPADAPPRSDILVRPAHLAGPGGIDLPFRLASEHGWHRPFDAPTALVLISPQEGLALNRQHQQWSLTSTEGWTVRFCDRVPSEVSYDLITAAQEAEADPAAATAPMTGNRATVLLLKSGWSGFNRDGYRLVAAPDRRAALSWPESAPDPGPALTAAAETGVWTVQFSRSAPDHLLTAATVALLQPVARQPEQIPEQFRGLVHAGAVTADRTEDGPVARSTAARARGIASHPALRHLPSPALPPLATHYSPAGQGRRQPDPR